MVRGLMRKKDAARTWRKFKLPGSPKNKPGKQSKKQYAATASKDLL